MTTFQIFIYKQGKTWLFDEERLGIFAEPFVAGASELIQKYLRRKGMGRRKKNVLVTFSTSELSNYDTVLTVTEKCYPFTAREMESIFGGHLLTHIHNTVGVEDRTKEPTSAYYVDQEGDECWLCPAQLKFFGKVAEQIYVKFG